MIKSSSSYSLVPLLLLVLLSTSLVHSASGNLFNGETILHHVIDDKSKTLYDIKDPFFNIDLSITKHVVMLWIVAFFTVFISLYATRIYRQDINATPVGISNVFEISSKLR